VKNQIQISLRKVYFYGFVSALILGACNNTVNKSENSGTDTVITSDTKADIKFNGDTSKSGMKYIPGGTFMMGADNDQASEDEYPKHKVTVAPFWIDEHEVTNAQFAEFVEATGYVTTAEKKPDWEEIKKQLPPRTPKPDESKLVAASLVFTPPSQAVDLNNYAQWWSSVPGASWKHPE